jgi:hypothetical protein
MLAAAKTGMVRVGAAMVLAAVAQAAAVDASATGHAAGPTEQRADDYLVIVHPSNPARTLTRSFVRSAYLKKTVSWPNGETIRPVGLNQRFEARQRFAREALLKSPTQLRAYWNQQIFSGKGVPPPEVDSEAAVIAHVLRHRGALGFLSATADPGRATVVTLQ